MGQLDRGLGREAWAGGVHAGLGAAAGSFRCPQQASDGSSYAWPFGSPPAGVPLTHTHTHPPTPTRPALPKFCRLLPLLRGARPEVRASFLRGSQGPSPLLLRVRPTQGWFGDLSRPPCSHSSSAWGQGKPCPCPFKSLEGGGPRPGFGTLRKTEGSGAGSAVLPGPPRTHRLPAMRTETQVLSPPRQPPSLAGGEPWTGPGPLACSWRC